MHRTIWGVCGHTQSGHSRDIPKGHLFREFAQCWHKWKEKFFLVLVHNRSLVLHINLVFFSFAFLCVFTSMLVYMHVCPRRSEVKLGCFFFFLRSHPYFSFLRQGLLQNWELTIAGWPVSPRDPPASAALVCCTESGCWDKPAHTLLTYLRPQPLEFGFF